MEASMGEAKKIEVPLLWPLSNGQDVQVCNVTAVSTLPELSGGGYVLELGRFFLTGGFMRDKDELTEYAKQTGIEVLGRFFMTAKVLQNLLKHVQSRLSADGVLPAEAAKE
jgi:hypothetical protein